MSWVVASLRRVTVRVRFSPAPTGYLHVGSARSALFNWMYARHTGGTMMLRIEDTDADRSRPELVDAIHESLRWLGIDWDELHRQSDRFDRYRSVANDFLARGLAYRCDCSQEAVRERAEAAGTSGYDGHCRTRAVKPGEGVVVRFRTPDEGIIGWDDVVRGRVEFDCAVLEDFVIVRSSGVPMFHVANAVDDLDMAITHVIRGEDLVNTTPRVLLLREALGAADQPVYAHLPLIVNEKRQKLSKRRDDVSVGDYRARGFLPDAMRNYLLTLGWGPKDDIEIAPIEKFVDQFELSDINASPAFFDVRKLEHFNAEYIRAMTTTAFVEAALPFLDGVDPEVFTRLAPLVQQRVKRLDEVPGFLTWVVAEPAVPIEKDWNKVMTKPEVPAILDLVSQRLATCEWTAESIESVVLGVGVELDVKRTQPPVRLALTGAMSGLPLFEPMVEMDRSIVLGRLAAARSRV